jgi:hypothetical protein
LVSAIVCSAANRHGITFTKWWLSASSSRFHGCYNRDPGDHAFTACEIDPATTTGCLATASVLSKERLRRGFDETCLEKFEACTPTT